MKNVLKFSFALLLGAFAFLFTGCEQEPDGIGNFSLTIKEVGPDYVDFFVTAPGTVEMAYTYGVDRKVETAMTLFSSGKKMEVSPAKVFRITNLQSETEHWFYAVVRLDDVNFSDVAEISFTTKKFNFTDLITIVETYNDGFKAQITVPESTKQAGRVIRYGGMCVPWYNYLTSQKQAAEVDLQAVVANGNPYGNYVKRDSTLVMNDNNVVLLDENGDPIIDEYGEQMDIHDPIVPNEPYIFFAGECRWGSPDEYAAIMGFNAPTGDSYSIASWDVNTGTWTGPFQKLQFVTRESEDVDLDFTIDIPEEQIDVTDAMVYFTAGKDVKSYFYMILDSMTYNQLLTMYLAGNEDWMQWYLTSYMAFKEFAVVPETRSTKVNAASKFREPLRGGDSYHVIATVFGDDLGLKQEFYHKTFTAKDKTKLPPVIEVKAVQNGNPYEATFNIKAPNKDVVGAYWACNYSREFEIMFNQKLTYPDILFGNYEFDSKEIYKINSDEGYTVSFYTLDGETTRMAVYGCNDEYSFNLIDEETHTAAWDDYVAPMADSGKQFTTKVIDRLEGDWTATATIVARELAPDGESVISYNTQHQSKVTISKSAPGLPSTLTDDIYGLYHDDEAEDGGRSNVDMMFEELQMLTENFTQYRLEKNNRVLCSGFLDYDPTKRDFGLSRMEFRSPFTLFTSTDYTSMDVSQLMYDFGPKWYIEELEDGSLIVPFTATYLPPMHNWAGYAKYRWEGYTFYLGGVGNGAGLLESNEEYPGFPVEVSKDYDRITIKPLVVKDGLKTSTYYMNSLGVSPMNPNEMDVLATVISDIVLTKGWNGADVMTNRNSEIMSTSVIPMSIEGNMVTELPEPKVFKSMTKLEARPEVEYEIDETPNVVTMDMLDAAGKRILKHFGLDK